MITALPPTIGHRELIKFASEVASHARVLIIIKDGEPYQTERVEALRQAFNSVSNVEIVSHHTAYADEGVGDMDFWVRVATQYGFRKGDYFVASETWGKELADMLGGVFLPYDLGREIEYSEATLVRRDLNQYFDWVLPEFQKYLRTRIVLFGAESVGKTTLAKRLVQLVPHSQFIFEYARPYLESLDDKTLDVNRMTEIWKGQKALQKVSFEKTGNKVLIHDTDLYSTLGYWEQWQHESVPAELIVDAEASKADLYLLLQSNIPFEHDEIRYGGAERETADQYWIDLLEQYNLNYRVIQSNNNEERITEALDFIDEVSLKTINFIRRD